MQRGYGGTGLLELLPPLEVTRSSLSGGSRSEHRQLHCGGLLGVERGQVGTERKPLGLGLRMQEYLPPCGHDVDSVTPPPPRPSQPTRA